MRPEPMPVRIRRCSISDLDALQNIAFETYAEAFRSMNKPETIEAYLRSAFTKVQIEKELNCEKSQFFFLTFGESLVGYLKLNEAPCQSDINDPDSLEIERIYIRSQFLRKNLGRKLIDFAVRQAELARKTSVWLGVWEKNKSAIAFYQKMGFSQIGEHLFKMGEELQNDLILKMNIGSHKEKRAPSLRP